MIRKFEKIENLGVFSNYKSPRDMDCFERFNLIYGLNGSGKTTLSRFFADLNKGTSEAFPDLKYKIKTDDGSYQQGKPYPRGVRVFNSEYVEANIGQLEGRLNPIYIIGEENKVLAESVEEDERVMSVLVEKRKDKNSELEKLKKEKGQLFTKVAPKITEAAQSAVIRTYNKRHAEAAYDDLTESRQLTVEELAQISGEIQRPALDVIDLMAPMTQIGFNQMALYDAIEYLRNLASALTQKSAISSAIQHLKENPELAIWVEQGRALHAKKDDQKCEYCGQIIPEEREKELEAHFNKSDSDLKKEIEYVLEETEKVIEDVERVQDLSKKSLYPEFSNEWNRSAGVITGEKIKMLSTLKKIKTVLSTKLTRRTESYSVEIDSLNSSVWDTAWMSIYSLIREHNVQTHNYNQRKENHFKRIEEHYLSEIDGDVKEKTRKIDGLENQINIFTKGNTETNEPGIEDLEKRIRDNRAQISNSHQAAEDLSQKLASFLGRDDLKFESEEEGYRVMRYGRAAKRLSEGEKTAIAFLYFTVGLEDQDFNLKEGIVVIDDPISSLDSSSLYQAFSYLKESVKDARQIFLLTHNFEFLKLLLDWFYYLPKSEKTYWMLHCSITETDTRDAEIKPLDKVLLENKNELAYLLNILVDFKSDGTIAKTYPIPNIMRKVLETFLEQHSSGKSLYQRLEKIDFDGTKKCAIYKFTNDQSHPTLSGLDPALVLETQTNINHLLEMIEEVAPVYYKALTEKLNHKGVGN